MNDPNRLCFIIPLIYGSIIFHRTRRDGYASVSNPNRAPLLDALPEYPAAPTNYAGYNAKAYTATDIEAQPSRERSNSYNHQRDTRFEAFRSSSYGNESSMPYSAQDVHGDIGYRGTMPTGGRSSGRGSPEIPQVFVQHHDGDTYEMESNSRRDLQ